jgi:hypothetical protein
MQANRSGDSARSALCMLRRGKWTGIAAIHNLRVGYDSFGGRKGLEMALQDPQAEPSMEEILASIRRIISEEEQAPNARGRRRAARRRHRI